MYRAHGLALPAMAVAVPLAAALLRRVSPAAIMLLGLAFLAVADAAGGFADSAATVGLLRVGHGLGAGLLAPATLAAAWRTVPAARVVWAAALAVGLMMAQALALLPIDEATSWRVTLQPYPMVTGVALALGAIYFVLCLRTGDPADARADWSLPWLPTLASSAAIALLAIGTTFSWMSAYVLPAAGLSLVLLLVLASFERVVGHAGRSAALVMIIVGMVVLPTAAQVTNVELRGLGGPGLSGLWLSFAVASAMAVVAAAVGARVAVERTHALVWAGLLLVVGGLVTVRLMVPVADGLPLIALFGLLSVGTALSVVASLRRAGPMSAVSAVSLCFSAVLIGYMLSVGIQFVWLRGVVPGPEMADALVGAVHEWALVAGFLVLAVIVYGAFLARQETVRAGAPAVAGPAAEAPDTPVPPPASVPEDTPPAHRSPSVRQELAMALLVPSQPTTTDKGDKGGADKNSTDRNGADKDGTDKDGTDKDGATDPAAPRQSEEKAGQATPPAGPDTPASPRLLHRHLPHDRPPGDETAPTASDHDRADDSAAGEPNGGISAAEPQAVTGDVIAAGDAGTQGKGEDVTREKTSGSPESPRKPQVEAPGAATGERAAPNGTPVAHGKGRSSDSGDQRG
ncbi:hypothetical protein Ssi02_74830 [Sinosporangium siamense]|uniref:MFS transporter n=2 Tax=Sinosporangium siamense TaxID=1367973 RepID=A0A919RNX7_9ACTN|nr:hypothetical protein Ssi02_74830 [Sinosporangium siamense]